jgi:hypothetical protein
MDAQTQRKITDMAARGMTAYGIAQALNAQGVPSPSGRGKWHHHSVERAMSLEARAKWAAYMKGYRARKSGQV